MKHYIHTFYKIALVLSAFIIVVSCQKEEVIIENPPPGETIEVGSALFDQLIKMAENEGSVDDIIDNTSCASVALPITIIVNGIEITINSVEDIALILKIYNNTETDEDVLELLFPITLVLPDYSTIVIENQEALNAFIESCTPVLPPCIDFIYPISFSVFNLQFEFIETVTITSDIELYFFLQSLNENEQIINLNYPVSLAYDNGTTTEVTNNEELATAISVAAQNCEIIEGENDCPPNFVISQLLECFWAPSFYDGNPLYQFYHFTFFENNSFSMSTSNSFIIDGTWEIFEEGENTYLQIEGTPPLLDPFEGTWRIVQCADGQFILENNADVQILFERNCDEDLSQCLGSGQGICDDDGDGFVTVNFGDIVDQAPCNDPDIYNINFHLTFEDAVAGTNPLPPVFQTTEPNTQFFYYAIVEIATNELLYVSNFQIDAEDCGGCDNPGILTEDLVIYIPFGNEVRELMSDTSLALAGSFVEDRDGNPNCAVGFEMGDDPIFIPVTDQNNIRNQDAFTISLWFKMQNDDAGNFESIFSNTLAPFEEGFAVSLYDLNTPLFVTSGAQGLWDEDWNQQVDVEWTNTDWHHLVVTVTANNEMKLYRDGILRNQAEVPDLDIETDPSATSYIINVGFVGHVDDLRVYKKALNENEISTLFNLEGDCFDCL